MDGNGKFTRGSKDFDVGGHIGKLHLLNASVGPYELRIDGEGRWFHGGIEIVRKDIVRLFSAGLKRLDNGSYVVTVGNDEAPIVVEDAPFVALRVEAHAGGLRLLLSDDSRETLLVETITFRDGNIPYCLVRGNLEAKFSRQAYYQLAQFIEYDEKHGSYYLSIGGKRRKIRI